MDEGSTGEEELVGLRKIYTKVDEQNEKSGVSVTQIYSFQVFGSLLSFVFVSPFRSKNKRISSTWQLSVKVSELCGPFM